jgi:predicted dehydrogenase
MAGEEFPGKYKDKQPMIRLGIIGCGKIARSHGRAAHEISERISITACCDPSGEAARAWTGEYAPRAKIYSDYHELIRGDSLDGIIIATWPNLHRDQIIGCLEAGARYILCEKTLTVSREEAMAVWTMSEKVNGLILEGLTYTHHPRLRQLQNIIASGTHGPVESIRGVFNLRDDEENNPDDPTRNWRQKRDCGGGVPWDLACYPIDACNAFAGGLPVRVYCTGRRSVKYGTVTRMHGLIDYENGTIGIVESTKQSSCQDLQVILRDAVIDMPDQCWSNSRDAILALRIRKGLYDTEHEILTSPPADRFVNQLTHFADLIEESATPQIPLERSVINLYVTDALIKSLERKEPVDVRIPKEIRGYPKT